MVASGMNVRIAMKANPPDHRTEVIAAGMLTNGYVKRWVWDQGQWIQITCIIHGTRGVTIRGRGPISYRVVLRFSQGQTVQITTTPGYSLPLPRGKNGLFG